MPIAASTKRRVWFHARFAIDKAAGVDGVAGEMLTYGCIVHVERMCVLFNI